MKTNIILLTLISMFLFTSCSKEKAQPQAAATEQSKPQAVDTSGAKMYPAKIPIVSKIDSIDGYVMMKAFINEKSLTPELKVIRYLNENKDTFPNSTIILPATKR